jgi:LPXTG-motif cell wall-anchored protein
MKDGNITFQTNHFSTYVFVEKAVTEASETGSTNTSDVANLSVTAPKTGENNMLWIALLVMVIGSGLILTAKRSRKRIPPFRSL